MTDGTVPLGTDYEASTSIEDGKIVIRGFDGGNFFVTGSEFTTSSDNVTGTISNDLTEIYITNGVTPNWYCLVE